MCKILANASVENPRRLIGSKSLSVFAAAFMAAQAVSSNVGIAHDGLADLAEMAQASVVNIIVTPRVVSDSSNKMEIPDFNLPEGNPIEKFFENFREREFNRNPFARPASIGSGFVISNDGFVVTNDHVIRNAAEIWLEFSSGERFEAELVGTDPKTDIALLKAKADHDFEAVSFGDSDKARVGDYVFAIGNPFGHGFSVSAGIISARNRELAGAYDDFIQTDAAINQGNSGGPLFNMEGEVIGVITAITTRTGGSMGIGFAMSSAVVANVVDQLSQYGTTKRGWLGVRIQDVSSDMAEALNLESAKGAIVASLPDGPAKDAGIQVGDVIISFAGQEVIDTRDLVRRVADSPVGGKVSIELFRDGESIAVTVTLGRREEAETQITPASRNIEKESEPESHLGMELGEITERHRDEFGIGQDEEGLIVLKVDPNSSAFDKGVRDGDVVSEAGGSAVTSLEEFEDRIAMANEAGRKSLLLLLRRAGQSNFVALPIDE
ncbi:MAG: Do family serine endopeptidase [Albidovulum sp.]|nr:Do family serine endopeptidase [Albidovulum sp.]MDE0529849.1 Do family serine endopeptidase [Albidovulum sp.]